ncbi:MAG: FAD-binding oxidoreductase, partial [Alphaproteobacteria bacterium]|nr:FAD-binding oxidoreductase [Alphaproteobacteria bacterium]
MNSEAAARLKAAVGPKGFTEDQAEIAPHLEEWRSKYKGRAALLLKPATTAEVSAILSICNETTTPVVPQAGNTGLVGGQIPFDNEILLSLSRLNRIRRLDAVDASMIAEAGVILAAAQRAADDSGLMLPLSLAAEGSCTIGGTLSTNAGGLNVLRYGMAREQVLGIEAVLADGRVLNLLRTLRKDNTGYDLKQLFIGAEGTLGIVTAAALKLFPKPAMRCTAFVAVPSIDAAVGLLARLQAATGGLVNAFEILPRSGLELVLAYIPGTSDPFAASSPWYALAEVSGAAALKDVFEGALEGALSNGLTGDAVIAASEAQRAALWMLRESMSEAQKKEGPSLKHDVSVPVAAVADFVAKATAAVSAALPGARPVPFGHLGDGNIHFNIQAARGADMASFLARWDEIARVVHDVVRDFGGSFSAEHGIGVMKRADLKRYKSEVEIDLM